MSEAVRRAIEGKALDPTGAYNFVLKLFDTAAQAQVSLVTDIDSASGCEAELRILAGGSSITWKLYSR